MKENNRQRADNPNIIRKLSGLYNQLAPETNIEYTKECISEALHEIMELRNQLDLITLLFKKDIFGE